MLPARLPRRAACRTGKAENRLWRGLSKTGALLTQIPLGILRLLCYKTVGQAFSLRRASARSTYI